MARPSSGNTVMSNGMTDRTYRWMSADPRDQLEAVFSVRKKLGRDYWESMAWACAPYELYWQEPTYGFWWDELVGACDD